MKIPSINNNQDTICTEQRKNIRSCRGKMNKYFIKANLVELQPTSQRRL